MRLLAKAAGALGVGLAGWWAWDTFHVPSPGEETSRLRLGKSYLLRAVLPTNPNATPQEVFNFLVQLAPPIGPFQLSGLPAMTERRADGHDVWLVAAQYIQAPPATLGMRVGSDGTIRLPWNPPGAGFSIEGAIAQ